MMRDCIIANVTDEISVHRHQFYGAGIVTVQRLTIFKIHSKKEVV